MGEKFAVNPVTGTTALTVPIAVSPGRSNFTPRLSLAYDSGAGNGPFGLGWTLSSQSVTRKTDKGLPRYFDGEESDVFILSGDEDLVPVLDSAGQRARKTRTVHGIDYNIYYYRPRTEGLFARIERWEDGASGISHWRTISKDNVTTLYGFEAGSVIVDPTDPARIFSYLMCRAWDDKGNTMSFAYVADDGTGVDMYQAHEANRTPAIRGTQRYLKSVRYGNSQPYFPNWSADGQETPLPPGWYFQVVLDYGDHSTTSPTPVPDQPWAARPDPFSTYRSGFEVRTYRRVQRVLMFHNFPAEQVGADSLVRSTDFVYSDQVAPADRHNPIYTTLASIAQTGYRAKGPYPSRSLPPLELEYSQPAIQSEILTLDEDSQANLPRGVDGSKYQWVDLDGEGLSGALTDLGDAWGFKRNLSPNNQVTLPDGGIVTRARLGPLTTLELSPSWSPQKLMDLDGSGRLDLVQLTGASPGFFERNADRSWAPFHDFGSLPSIDWSDPKMRFVDLTGDGLADVLVTDFGLFTFYPSLGTQGFGRGEQQRTPWDEERGPRLVLADGTQTIFLADMTGDGLTDLVRVRNGEICYWPNLGYGRFGAKVTMDKAPRLDNDEQFDPRRIRLADIDGSGTVDLVYIGVDGVQACFNQSGNAWSAPSVIALFPSTDTLSDVEVTDLLGSGTACLVWSTVLPDQAARALLYVDLMGGSKPHLLIRVRNNLGAETRLTYAPSTRFYLADEAAGTPWVTRLPHVVHVVDRMEAIDWIGHNRAVTRYAYHHGYFDGYEREFRGFGSVEQWDTEEFRTDTTFPEGETLNWNQASWSPPVHTKTWFHTGAFEPATAVSRQYSHEYWSGDTQAAVLPDTILPPGLGAFDVREAYRSLRGQMLRTETYADDGSSMAANPFTVIEHNLTIRCIQLIGSNKHAVFHTHPRESITYQYERNPTDPRVTHAVTLEVDGFGNPTRSVAIGYPRRPGRTPPEPSLDPAEQAMLDHDQGRLHVRGVETHYTNAPTDPASFPDVAWPAGAISYSDSHRVPLVSAIDEAEITGVAPGAGLFTFDELDGMWPIVWSGGNDIPYEAIPVADVDGSGALPPTPTRRLVKQSRTLYRSDDLTALLPLGQLEPLALRGESYQGALTAGLLAAIFGTTVTSTTLADGGYVPFTGEAGWWIRSGRLYYSRGLGDPPTTELPSAQQHFFLGRQYVDPFGAVALVDYDDYDLLVKAMTDPVLNITSATSDYRVLMPDEITDPNLNRVQVRFDILGRVVGTALLGKVTETLGDTFTTFTEDLDDVTIRGHLQSPLVSPGDILGSATTRFVYDPDAYYRTRSDPQPAAPITYALARETHVADLGSSGASLHQHSFSYSDGFGREIQRKAHADPGPLVDGGPDVDPRWVGSGWTIFDNKGRPVRKYEPFFSATNAFEFAVQTGVSSVLFYDSPGRQVAVLHPDSTWEKVIFDPWRQDSWDGNDTVLISDPRTDADVGDHFVRLLGGGPGVFVSWYQQRIGGAYGSSADDKAAQQDAAQKAAAHASTPTTLHIDALGRTCMTVRDNGAGGRYPSRVALDTEGKPLAVFDALGRRAVEHCLRISMPGGARGYVAGLDMGGNALYQNCMDGGARRSLLDVAGRLFWSWDARDHAFAHTYDPAGRLTHLYVSTAGAAVVLRQRLVYGEGQSAYNVSGRLFRHYDPAGAAITDAYDFKGNLLSSSRWLAADYHAAPDWIALKDLTDPAALDLAAGPQLSTIDRFDSTNWFDALNRVIQSVTPHSTSMSPNVVRPSYNEANLLAQVNVWRQQPAAPSALLDPSTADLQALTALTYNARGQRASATDGSQTVTTYEYDPSTFRLVHLTTARPPTLPAGQQVVQDLSYYYDPVGNITRIRDTADIQNVIFFNNQRVEPSNDYTYDPVYRLTAAAGREHLGQTAGALSPPPKVSSDDSFRVGLPQPGDGLAMGNYLETYDYDAVGNILALSHVVSSGSWNRQYSYADPSQIDPAQISNRLSATPGEPSVGSPRFPYIHDRHGNMVRMPHMPSLAWDEQDRLASTSRQVVNAGIPETTFYTYDSSGQRAIKATDGATNSGSVGPQERERVYLGIVEIYREFDATGNVALERETLHVNAAAETVCLCENRTIGTDQGSLSFTRYWHSNHLGSAVLELDDKAQIISYEEYFPYGSTSYQAVANQMETPKRYRYTGKERDEESALCYHGTRYYAPWLGRWTSADPLVLAGNVANAYAYVAGRVTIAHDPNGTTGIAGNALFGKTTERLVGKLMESVGNLVNPEPVYFGKTGAVDFLPAKGDDIYHHSVDVKTIDIGADKYRLKSGELSLAALGRRFEREVEQATKHTSLTGLPQTELYVVTGQKSAEELKFIRWLVQGMNDKTTGVSHGAISLEELTKRVLGPESTGLPRLAEQKLITPNLFPNVLGGTIIRPDPKDSIERLIPPSVQFPTVLGGTIRESNPKDSLEQFIPPDIRFPTVLPFPIAEPMEGGGYTMRSEQAPEQTPSYVMPYDSSKTRWPGWVPAALEAGVSLAFMVAAAYGLGGSSQAPIFQGR
jgi:RHS repeat-associated protein